MKNKYIIISIGLIGLYVALGVYLFIKTETQKYFVEHFILVVIGAVSLLIANYKMPSEFLRIFTIIAIVFFLIESFGSICFSIVRHNLLAFENMGVLARTEGFIAFTVLGFLLYGLRKRTQTGNNSSL